jgi:hypothetical protein
MDQIQIDKIQNIGIYKQSLDLKIQLEVLGQSLNKLQADNVTLANAFCYFQIPKHPPPPRH